MTVISHVPAPVHQSPSSQIHAICHAVFLIVFIILRNACFVVNVILSGFVEYCTESLEMIN